MRDSPLNPNLATLSVSVMMCGQSRCTHVCVETTGASAEILKVLLSLAPAPQTRVARVLAPLDVCLSRIALRDQQNKIPMDTDMIRKVHAHLRCTTEAGLILENSALTEEDIVSSVRKHVSLHQC